jgi:hypothetical protein
VAAVLDVIFEHCGKRPLSAAAKGRLGKSWGPVFRRYMPEPNPDNPIPAALVDTGMEVVPRFAGEIGGAVKRRMGRSSPPAPESAPVVSEAAARVDGEAVQVDVGGRPGFTPNPFAGA